jgi:hypothetical protein
MSALFPSLLAWPFALLIAVPALIHLITLLRRRRVRWAAMEFLFVSQKKNRRWVLLRQWLLLAARTAAIGLVLLLLAGLVLSGDWAKLFGGGPAQHFILVDDSLSMSAQSPGGSAFDRARTAASQLAAQIAQENTPQRVTLLPYTTLADQTWDEKRDLLFAEVDPQTLGEAVSSHMSAWSATQLATAPLGVLEGLSRLLAQGEGAQERTVHLLTDFRTHDWLSAPAVREALARLADSGVKIHLVNCAPAASATTAEPNLAVEHLTVLPGARAASVPQLVEVAVQNFSSESVDDLTVQVAYRQRNSPLGGSPKRERGEAPKDAAPQSTATASPDAPESSALWTALPAIELPPIKPGATAANRIQIRFPAAGNYELRATLSGPFLARDAIVADNEAFGLIDIAVEVPVLIIDADARDDDAFHLTTALRPGSAKTGLSVTVQPPAFLRDQSLSSYAAIYLLDVPRLEPAAVAALEAYARSGGGVAFFLGPNAHRAAINDLLYRNGEGLFPLPIEGPIDLPYQLPSLSAPVAKADSPGAAPTSDIVFDRHAALARLAGEAYQGFAPHVARYVAVDAAPLADGKSATAVLARLRNNAPLIVARPFGEGRSVAILTTAGRAWSDWAGTLTFPILMQELHGYLSAARQTPETAAVGAAVQWPLDPGRFLYTAQATCATPYEVTSGLATITRPLASTGQGAAARLLAAFGERDRRETGRAGIYEIRVADKDGAARTKQFVRNTSIEESNLAFLDGRAIADELKGVDYVYHDVAELHVAANRIAGAELSPYLLVALVALLAIEQALAYLAGYHARREAAI